MSQKEKRKHTYAYEAPSGCTCESASLNYPIEVDGCGVSQKRYWFIDVGAHYLSLFLLLVVKREIRYQGICPYMIFLAHPEGIDR